MVNLGVEEPVTSTQTVHDDTTLQTVVSSVMQGGFCVSWHKEALGSELIAGHSIDGVPSLVGGNVVFVAGTIVHK